MNRRQSIVVVVAMAVLAMGLMVALSPYADPFFDDDSTAYVEAGRNVAEGRGFVTWPYGPEEFPAEFVPLQLFPPGFPLLVSIVVRLGATAESAATWIPRVCFALLPLVLFGVLRFVLGRTAALVATFASCFLPAVLFHSLCAMSDVPFLLVVLLGFLCVFRGVASGRARWLLAAGLLAGAAASIRNAGYAGPAAVTVAFVLCGRWRRLPLYLAGFGAAYAPVVLRNLLVFGTALPYDMPPSGLTIPQVLREALRAFDEMFVAHAIPWAALVPALMMLSLGTVVWLWRAGVLRQLPASRRVDLLAGTVLFLYAGAGVGMILLTRFRFAVDPINPRFLIQYHWVLVAWCTLLGAQALRRTRIGTRGRAIAAAAVLGLLLAPQVPLARMQAEHMAWSRGIAEDHAGLRGVIAGLSDETLIAAFHAPQLHLMYDRQVYQMPPEISPKVASEFVGDRPLVVLMYPYEYEQFHDWWGIFDGDLPPGFREIGRSGRVIALERP